MQDGAALSGAVSRQHVVSADDDQEPYLVDWRGRYRGRAVAVVKPASTEEVAAVVRLCAGQGVVVPPQGGNTGMCGAATPPAEGRSVVVRLDRMNRIRAVSPLANSITVEAGCILANIHADLGGSAQAEPCRAGPDLARTDDAWPGRLGARLAAADDRGAAGGTPQGGISGACAGDASGRSAVSDHLLGGNGCVAAAAAFGGRKQAVCFWTAPYRSGHGRWKGTSATSELEQLPCRPRPRWKPRSISTETR
jgi:FAD/FMN-containing dehydrogenase